MNLGLSPPSDHEKLSICQEVLSISSKGPDYLRISEQHILGGSSWQSALPKAPTDVACYPKEMSPKTTPTWKHEIHFHESSRRADNPGSWEDLFPNFDLGGQVGLHHYLMCFRIVYT